MTNSARLRVVATLALCLTSLIATTTASAALPRMMRLPGVVVSASSSALLTNTLGTETDAINFVIVAVHLTKVVHPRFSVRGTDPGCDGYTCLPSGVVTDPSAGYPQGAALFIFAVTRSASGLTPEKTTNYVEAVNVATGASTTPRALPTLPSLGCGNTGSFNAYATYGVGTILTFGVDMSGCGTNGDNDSELYRVNTRTGALLNHAAIGPGGGSVDGKYVSMIVNDSVSCSSSIVDEVTLHNVGTIPICGSAMDLAGNDFDYQYLPKVMTASISDGYFSVRDIENLNNPPPPSTYAVANGTAVTPQVVTSGPRSALAIGGESALTLDTTQGLQTYRVGSWTPGYSVGAAQAQSLSLQTYGLCDNDVWAWNSSQAFIFDGRSGKVLRYNWKYLPEFGGSGWTVVKSEATVYSGLSTEYLVRGKGTLVSLLG